MANFPKPSGLSIVWSATGNHVEPTASRISTGYVVEMPPYETQNWIEFRQDSFLAHLNQHGMAVWDADTEYQGNISYTKGSNGIIYKCLITNTNTDPTNPLNSATWVQAFETYGAVAVVQSQLNAFQADYATLAGIANPAAARVNLSVWSRTESDTRYAPITGNPAQTFAVAPATQPEHAVRLGQVSGLLTQATESTIGVAALATNAKVAAGVDDLTIITPLKAATVYLSKAGNLAGLGNVATARSNLGLGSMALESATGFLRTTNNLSDVSNVVAARANLGLTSTATQPETYFLRSANNLSDVVDKPTARNNLGLTSTAVTALSALMQKAENLAGLTNVPQARVNLGLGSAAVLNSDTWLTRANNLGDLTNAQTARNNLGLGSAATRNVVGVISDLNFSNGVSGGQGYTVLPNGWIMQAGNAVIAVNTRINFPVRMNVLSIQMTVAAVGTLTDIQGRVAGLGAIDANGFYAYGATTTGPATLGIHWFAIGTIAA